ncbi:60s ribosomal protein L15, partial [Pseudoloma neurophilia]
LKISHYQIFSRFLQNLRFLKNYFSAPSEMPATDYLEAFRHNKQSDVCRYLSRIRMWEFRQRPSIHRAEVPTHPDKARKYGYKSKAGFYIFRFRVKRGGRPRKADDGNTHGKPSKSGIYQRKPNKNLQAIGEIRLGRKLGNLRMLGSYWVAEDREYKVYEAVMVNPMEPAIRNSGKLNWICKDTMKHRECRGLTPAARKSRGLGKGHRFNQTNGGSKSAAWRKRNTLSLLRYR